MSSAMEAAVYRLVQEGLSNAAKHAYPSYVLVEITYQAQLIKIVVKDNGLGFNVKKSVNKPTGKASGWWECANAWNCWREEWKYNQPRTRAQQS